jgi:hypothetical protein
MLGLNCFLFLFFVGPWHLPTLVSASSESSASGTQPKTTKTTTTTTLIILDVDNTLYQEKDVGIEAQIIRNTYKYCKDHLDLSNNQADELFHTYASTIEGLRRTLWKDQSPLQRQASLDDAYHRVWNVENMDLSSLLPLSQTPEKGGGSSTGYSHTQNNNNNKEKDLVRRLLQSSPYPIVLASNSPSWHIHRVLDAMGLNHGKDIDDVRPPLYQAMYTPDRLETYPTKHDPIEFFRADPRSNNLDISTSVDRLLVLDDSAHNLKQIQSHFSKQTTSTTSQQCLYRIGTNYTLKEALLQAYGLVDPNFVFSQVKYLQCKSVVDRQAMDPLTWHMAVDKLRQLQQSNSDKNDPFPIRIVDLGAGLLSMLQLVIHGDSENGLRPLLLSKEKSDDTHFPIHYTAYESNRGLFQACHERLLEWGFTPVLQSKHGAMSLTLTTEEEFIYEHPQILLRLRLYDYETEDRQKEINEKDAPPPDLIVGCCFADLVDPNHLVPSLIRRFNLLRHSKATQSSTLLYFPITFCGTTQFVPPQPFERYDTSSSSPSSSSSSSGWMSRNKGMIPSDTAAFQFYAKALSETLGHNLNPRLLQDVLVCHGASLLRQGPSSWNIDPKKHSYLFDAMMYFFGTSGGPELLEAGWDAQGWIQRAKQHQPTIRVSNVDLLFEMGRERSRGTPALETVEGRGTATTVPKRRSNLVRTGQEILFTAPNQVGTAPISITEKELGPNQVLGTLV